MGAIAKKYPTGKLGGAVAKSILVSLHDTSEIHGEDMHTCFTSAAGIVAAILLAIPANAQTATSSLRLTGDLHPQSEHEARILLDRVENAATEVCGASRYSVVEYSRAIRHSSCWRQSVSDAVAHIANPLLSNVYAGEAK
jgi:UrcA family protein